MSLPASEPISPEGNTPLPPARLRRKRRSLIDLTLDERTTFVRQLAQRLTPGADFFMFSAFSGIAIAVAILMDTPALYILAALLAPFMSPVIGMGLATVVGSFRYFFETLASIVIGALIVFLFGALGGWLSSLWPGITYQQTIFHTYFSWPDFVLLTLGAGLTTFMLVRAPQSRPLVTSVAVAYEIYLPVGVAGFGLTSQIPGLWPDGLIVFAVHLGWTALIGTIILAILGLRPLTLFGYTLASTIALVGIVAAVLLSGMGAAFGGNVAMAPKPEITQASPIVQSPPPTQTKIQNITTDPVSTVTQAILPTQTATTTVTIAPTPVWAQVYSAEFNGAVVRAEPKYGGKVVKIVENGDVVQILPETVTTGQVIWVHVSIPPDGTEGWMVQTLLITATPAPGW